MMSSVSMTIEEVVQQLEASGSMPAELLEIFREEAEDHLRTIYAGLGQLGENNHDQAALADVRRAAHTLKGAAGAVGLKAATQLAHRMEDLLDQLAANGSAISEVQLNLCLGTADQLEVLTTGNFDANQVGAQILGLYQGFANEVTANPSNESSGSNTPAKSAPSPNPAPTDETDRRTEPDRRTENAPGSSGQYIRVPLERLDELVNLLGEMTVNRSSFEHRLKEFESRIDDMQSTMARLGNATRYVESHVQERQDRARNTHPNGQQTNKFSQTKRKPDAHSEFDQLEFERFTDLHLLAQSISEADHDAQMMAGEFRRVKTSMASLLRQQSQLNFSAQQSLMRVRMVPLSSIVNKIERTVRTTANKVGKQIRLKVTGEHIELDKTVLDAITDPILHLIRNGIDHGIESADQRSRAGKPEVATLHLKAVNQGTQVTLLISDDGAGIDAEKVIAKAIEQNLISVDDELSPEEVHSLIFRPGFSTAGQLTDVSGRGVGMDVVKDAIAKLKGSIQVESETGRGTTFTIKLPTNVGVSSALIVESRGHSFAIPMQSISQSLRLDPTTVTHSGDGPQIALEQRTVALLDLACHLQLTESQAQPQFLEPDQMLIINNGVNEVALTVDCIVGSRDIVVKPLGSHLKNVPGFTGATIAGDGSLIPILDANEIVNPDATSLSFDEEPGSGTQVQRRNLAMVIDDSISVRRITEKLLLYSGWDVVTAKDGVDALETLADLDGQPDVFLCDMEMPRMDGIELVRQIREQSEFEMTPIVMVTSRASEKHRHKAFEAGASEYVIKPYDDQALIDLISQLVQSTRETVGS